MIDFNDRGSFIAVAPERPESARGMESTFWMVTYEQSSITFMLYGVPVPKGSKSIVTRRGKSVLVDGTMSKCKDADERGRRNKARRQWPLQVEVAAARAVKGREPVDGPVNVSARFFFARPKNESKAERLRIFHTTMPDLDKLLRGILDPMKKAGVFTDDARVVSFNGSEKRYVAFRDSCKQPVPGPCGWPDDCGRHRPLRPRVEITVTRLLETE